MRIAIVLNTSWNIFNFRMNLVRALQEQGHEVHTVAPNDDYSRKLTEAGCVHHNIRMDSRGANPLKDLGLIFELFAVYRRIKPDVIFHYTIKPNIYGTIAAKLLRLPVVNNVCGLGTVFLKNNLVSAIAVLLYRVSFRFARKVFFQNPHDLKLFEDKRLVTKEIADLVPGSGIDLRKFRPVSFKRNKTFTFLLISRLITDKGILEYIEAINKLSAEGMNVRFQLLGAMDPEHKRGIQRSVVTDWVRRGMVEYLGMTDDVRKYIRKADCVVLPSYREGTPRTLLEAASSSKPIVTTDVPGCNNVVTDNYNGLLCRLRDADDLAAKMRRMATFDNQQLRKMGENGRSKVEAEYSETVVINKYLEALTILKRAS